MSKNRTPNPAHDDAMNRRPGKKHTIRIYQDALGEYRWRRMAPNGRTISDSGEGYVEARFARRGMRLANPDYSSPEVRVVDHTTWDEGEDDDE